MTGLMYLAGMLSQTIGLQYTTAATSAFLTYLLIVIVPFVSFAIGKAWPTRITVVAIGVALDRSRAAHRSRRRIRPRPRCSR